MDDTQNGGIQAEGRFIEMPNVPGGAVCLAIADGRISFEIEKALAHFGVGLIKTSRHHGLYEAVAFHPDMMLHHAGGKTVVYAPGTGEEMIAALCNAGFRLILGESELSPGYPADIAYNVARVGGYYFHNLKYTDPVLKKELERHGAEPVHVSQGYSKCSVSIVDEKSMITADAGIAAAAEKKGLEVLKIDSTQGIILPGLNYGFIGGCSCLLDEKTWAVCGDAQSLLGFEVICGFLEKRNMRIVSLSDGHVVDFGSLIPLLTS